MVVFVTLVSTEKQVAAIVRLRDDSQVEIATEQKSLSELLSQIYRPMMTPMEFALANHLLNGFRELGITWEVRLREESMCIE